ncbi:hydantoinase/oxoprolinase family protein [soil metagenome]
MLNVYFLSTWRSKLGRRRRLADGPSPAPPLPGTRAVERGTPPVGTYRVGVDIGGTFTDIVLLGSDGSITTRKVASTIGNYGDAIVSGLREVFEDLHLDPGTIEAVVHGTTVATNALLEEKGARTALITTEGFRDVLELRRIRIPELYDLFYKKPAPLVPRRRRFEARERIGPKGDVRIALDIGSVDALVERLRAADAQALAICFLHSYVNPAHERAVGEIIRDRLPSLYVTLSCDLLPEIREYERTSTTVINAYVGPLVQHYIGALVDDLVSMDVHAPLLIMQSNGAVMTAAAAMEKPAHIIESGPAAGVSASGHLAARAGYGNVITFDMGGTTAKASMIENGELARTSEYEVGGGIHLSSLLVRGGGYALKLPLIDVSEIGAGGGSIVWLDRGGLIRIGPQSAGSSPGPVCYDTGGTEPTITDANIVLGYLNPHYLAGGRVRLNPDLARDSLFRRIAQPLDMPLLEASHGVYLLAANSMVRALKAVSTYRGRDPRDFSLLAFGGSGPTFAVEIARLLEMKRVIVPPTPGLFSAFGLLFSNIEHQFVQTQLESTRSLTAGHLEQAYGRLEEHAYRVLKREGYEPEGVLIERFADLRYAGQAYELTVPMAAGPVQSADIEDLVESFGEEHFKTYGHRAPDEPVDLVNVRVTGRVLSPAPRSYDPAAAIAAGDAMTAATSGSRSAYFGTEGQLQTPVVPRRELIAGPRRGPLIIEEYDSTCVVPPGAEASLDAWGSITVELDA